MMDKNLTVDEQLRYLVDMVQAKEEAPAWALALKLGEESGEFQSNLLHTMGHLHQKEMAEDIFGEAADVINCVMGTLAKLYPFHTAEEIVELLREANYNKGTKYERLLDEDVRIR